MVSDGALDPESVAHVGVDTHVLDGGHNDLL
jgi:hypothetical protein